jgi:hypothetical protein
LVCHLSFLYHLCLLSFAPAAPNTNQHKSAQISTHAHKHFFAVKPKTINNIESMNTQNAQNHQHNNVTGAPAPGTRTSLAQQPAPPPPPPPIDPATQWRIDFIKRKQRATAFFHQLTPEQQVTLCEWFGKLSVPEIRKRIAAPAPEGWALQISETVLRRTRALFFSGASNAATEEMLDTLNDMLPFTDLTNLNGVRHGLAHTLHLEAMHIVQRDPKSKDLKTVLANIQRLAALEFKRQQLELQREKIRSRRSY